MNPEILEPERSIPIAAEADLCVVGGSATGVFAAVAASRRGLQTAIVEANGFFGGVATAGLVSIWHSLMDTELSRPIIAGLTLEIIERLKKRRAIVEREQESAHFNRKIPYFVLNTEELKIELDELITEAKVRPFLHAFCTAPVMEGKRIKAVIIEDKSGRRAIRARYFIDATGDGDLLARAGFSFTKLNDIQPPTACAVVHGIKDLCEGRCRDSAARAVFCPENEKIIPFGGLWHIPNVALPSLYLVAGTRVPGADCSEADQLTRAEMEGRRQVRVMMDTFNRRPDTQGATLVSLPAWIGVRETRHAVSRYTLTEADVLNGRRFADAIANGSYKVDVHHSDKPGITMRYLDGRERYIPPVGKVQWGRWRDPIPADPTFYQIPYSSLLPEGAENLLAVGRLIGADRGAYGAIRVMVNCNQTGEAAGTAAAAAAESGAGFDKVEPSVLRRSLARGGAIII